jgi:hypothetical protein
MERYKCKQAELNGKTKMLDLPSFTTKSREETLLELLDDQEEQSQESLPFWLALPNCSHTAFTSFPCPQHQSQH